MNSIEKLTKIFSEFPGIGPRQARRFVYYLLTRANTTLQELSQNINDLKKDVVMCKDCRRFFEPKNKSDAGSQNALCKICSDQNRDRTLLMIVQRDIDLETVERNGGFDGVYFVLGGGVPILEKEPKKRVRADELLKYLERMIGTNSPSHKASDDAKAMPDKTARLREIILGTNWNPEGENTADYIKKLIEDIVIKNNIKISSLGKGLSMGTELEYIDPDTLKNALKNRG